MTLQFAFNNCMASNLVCVSGVLSRWQSTKPAYYFANHVCCCNCNYLGTGKALWRQGWLAWHSGTCSLVSNP